MTLQKILCFFGLHNWCHYEVDDFEGYKCMYCGKIVSAKEYYRIGVGDR